MKMQNKKKTIFFFGAMVCALVVMTACKCDNKNNENMKQELTLTQEWDKKFPKSDKVNHRKVTFHNRYGIELAADMYTPKGAEGRLAAIAVGDPSAVCRRSPHFLFHFHPLNNDEN